MPIFNKDSLTRPFRAIVDDPLGSLNRGVGSTNSSDIPATSTRTSYGLTIHAKKGNYGYAQIGAVHEVSVNQTLTVEEEFEVNALSKGKPRELVPQNLTARSLTLQRYDLYANILEEVFGSPELITLADQLGPVSMRMHWRSPTDRTALGLLLPQMTQSSSLRVYEFTDCWITTLGRTYSTGNTIVGASATITWRDLRRIN